MSVIFSDSFDRADSTDLGADWVERQGDVQIVSNRVQLASTASTINCHHSGGPYSTADYAVQATLNFGTTGPQAGVMARRVNNGVSDSDYYGLYLHSGSGKLRILRRSGGSDTLIGGVNFTVSAGVDYVLRLEVIGSTLVGKVDGVEYLRFEDSTLTAPGDAGIFSRGGTIYLDTSWDDFLVEEISSGKYDGWKRFPETVGYVGVESVALRVEDFGFFPARESFR